MDELQPEDIHSSKSTDAAADKNPSLLCCFCGDDNNINNSTQQEIVTGILGEDPLLSQFSMESIKAYSWNLNTKYYTCTVDFCVTTHRTIGDVVFANSVECILLHFSPDSADSWMKVKAWLPFIEHLEPSVKLLVCKSIAETNQITKSTVDCWCIENEFELIETTPSLDPDELDDNFDVYGIKRIIQALHAHTWPNLVLKDQPDTLSPYMKKLMEESKESSKVTEGDHTASQSTQASTLDLNTSELYQALHDEGEDGLQSFEKLFSKMQLMKEQADGLPPEERKAFAGKVAMSFLQALGGSDEESDEND